MTEELTEELKPCPFCGSKDVSTMIMPGSNWVVACYSCGCRTSEYYDCREAESVWNRRVCDE